MLYANTVLFSKLFPHNYCKPTVRCLDYPRSIKSSLPSLYPLRHSRDKIFQALYRFSVLQATKSWAGPGNEATLLRNYATRLSAQALLSAPGTNAICVQPSP